MLHTHECNHCRDRDFFLTLPLSNNRTPAGRVELELWDQDTFKVCGFNAHPNIFLSQPPPQTSTNFTNTNTHTHTHTNTNTPHPNTIPPPQQQDSLVATAVLDLSKLEPACLSYLELPLLFEKSKHATAGAHARLVVGVKGWVSAFGTLLADTQHIPGGCVIKLVFGVGVVGW